MIRDAGPQDAAAIAAIYNHAVLHTTAIWNEATVDAENRAAWIADRQGSGLPVLVAEAEGVTGYASYAPWRTFDGYRYTVEHSVYVAPDRHGRGIGSALLGALIGRARLDGLHVMVAAIEARNLASIRLHERHGFRPVGAMPQVGCKFGRWLDLSFLQLMLDERPRPGGPA